jgi:hypothetical protein
VVASPFDAAVHDAFGKLHGLHSYRTYGPAMTTTLPYSPGLLRVPEPLYAARPQAPCRSTTWSRRGPHRRG